MLHAMKILFISRLLSRLKKGSFVQNLFNRIFLFNFAVVKATVSSSRSRRHISKIIPDDSIIRSYVK